MAEGEEDAAAAVAEEDGDAEGTGWAWGMGAAAPPPGCEDGGGCGTAAGPTVTGDPFEGRKCGGGAGDGREAALGASRNDTTSCGEG